MSDIVHICNEAFRFGSELGNYVLWIIRTVLILIRMSAIDILFLVTKQAHYVIFGVSINYVV